MKRRRSSFGFGSTYDRDADRAVEMIDELASREARAQRAKARLYDAVESGSASRVFKAKQLGGDALADLSKTLEHARTFEQTFSLDRLPTYGEFAEAHVLMRELRREIGLAERTRRTLVKSAFGGAEEIRRGLAMHDRRRRR